MKISFVAKRRSRRVRWLTRWLPPEWTTCSDVRVGQTFGVWVEMTIMLGRMDRARFWNMRCPESDNLLDIDDFDMTPEAASVAEILCR